jgi:leucyl/phenylalanyl-tRNA---protein transferase
VISEMSWEQVQPAPPGHELPVAVGGSSAPHRLLEALRHAAFPYPRGGLRVTGAPPAGYARHVAEGLITAFPDTDPAEAALTWWSPASRPGVPVGAPPLADGLRSSTAQAPHWVVTCGHAFGAVVDACRRHGDAEWVTDSYRASLLALHGAGWAHSIEVWQGEKLIGGLFGTGMGGVFSVDSAFGRRPQALRVAFADLSRRLAGRASLIDLQAPHPYGASLSARSVTRAEFLDALLAVDLPLAMRSGVLAVQPLTHNSATA